MRCLGLTSAWSFYPGTVCNDHLNEEAVRMVCSEYGFAAGEVTTHFGAGTGPIWLDNVNCMGGEESLSDCSDNAYGEHNCNHEEDVGIVCDVNAVLPTTTAIPPECDEETLPLGIAHKEEVNGFDVFIVQACNSENKWGESLSYKTQKLKDVIIA